MKYRLPRDLSASDDRGASGRRKAQQGARRTSLFDCHIGDRNGVYAKRPYVQRHINAVLHRLSQSHDSSPMKCSVAFLRSTAFSYPMQTFGSPEAEGLWRTNACPGFLALMFWTVCFYYFSAGLPPATIPAPQSRCFILMPRALDPARREDRRQGL